MQFDIGSLVRVRGREWVVLPESKQEEQLLVLRPLGGTDDEITGIYTPLEMPESAQFPLPDPSGEMGNHRSCALLRDAVRLGFRSGAGPFRSLSHIAVEPRPYQLLPLLMGLSQDPVRLLIADDVGVGKTVESCLIARELLDRGEIERVAVLCPPHLAEQWQRALDTQFHIRASLVLSSTARRLERHCRPGESLFDRYPHVVVSTDYIKAEKRRDLFLNRCPELVIVDEAHTCAAPAGPGRLRQQRHELLAGLAKDPNRHLILVTATPHSGNEAAFRSLLALLNPEFKHLPEDLSGEKNRKTREHLAQYFVQRRRGDLKVYMDTETPFPTQEAAEKSYKLTPEYRTFFDKTLAFCRERVAGTDGRDHRQRVKWWSALAMLRALGSSPAAAETTFRNRAAAAEAETVEEADALGSRAVLDLDDETTEGIDVAPGGQTDDDADSNQRRLKELAREVQNLKGKNDAKLNEATKHIQKLITDGFSPIVFCRFIPTVDYVADHLRKKLKGVTVEGITGTLPPEERETRVSELAKNDKRVLVCTDCLSEGINLQESFDAVMHYDLSWNPTRHEQREGRVDRYGQPKKTVRTLTYFGNDNPVDGFVLEVLLRKHKSIRTQLGISVPVPMDTGAVVDAIFEALLLRKTETMEQLTLDLGDDFAKREMDIQWDAVVEREKKSRTLFAQHQMQKSLSTELGEALAESIRALGSSKDVESFTIETLKALSATVSKRRTSYAVDLSESPPAVIDALGGTKFMEVCFQPPVPRGAHLLTRTHPTVEGLTAYVLESALDQVLEGPAKRCGMVKTEAVSIRTILMLIRLRYHILVAGRPQPILAEDQVLVGFEGSPDNPTWLSEASLLPLLEALPAANLPIGPARDQLQRLIDGIGDMGAHISEIAKTRGQALLEAHQRVRKASKQAKSGITVEPHLPADVLGVFVYVPVPKGGAR